MAWGRSAGRPSLFPFGVSVILKSDSDMTKEEAKERFGDNIINKLLSLGAEPTNVCRNDDIVEWCSDGCIKVGDIEVWAYYYFYEGENPDLCNWEDRMEIKDKTLRYSVYRDGCFYPYYGKLEIIE